MFSDQGTSASGSGQQFMEGTPVYDVNGDKVGTVSEHGVQDNALVVHHGLFRQDVYVPVSTIARNDADGVYLNVAKEDVLNQDQYATSDGQTQAYDTTASTGTARIDSTTTQGEDIRVPLREEELVVGKQQEEVGRVHVHKDVIEEQQTINEPVTREQVTVERVPVQGQANDLGAEAFTEKDIDVPVMGEELVVGKRAVVTEEVRLHKDAITEQQQVSDTVRKERVTVDGADEVVGADNAETTTNTWGTTKD